MFGFVLRQTDFRAEFLVATIETAMKRSVAAMRALMFLQFVIGGEGFATLQADLCSFGDFIRFFHRHWGR